MRDARALAAGLTDEGLRIVSGGTDSHLLSPTCARSASTGRSPRRPATRSASRSTRTRSRSTRTPSTPSGVRVGTPGPSTLGMDEPEMREIASIMADVLKAPDDAGVKEKPAGVYGT